eukprot:364862-Chlamydomonas_euryale.AAC.11
MAACQPRAAAMRTGSRAGRGPSEALAVHPPLPRCSANAAGPMPRCGGGCTRRGDMQRVHALQMREVRIDRRVQLEGGDGREVLTESHTQIHPCRNVFVVGAVMVQCPCVMRACSDAGSAVVVTGSATCMQPPPRTHAHERGYAVMMAVV